MYLPGNINRTNKQAGLYAGSIDFRQIRKLTDTKIKV
jgi:hypothetical protein